MKNKFLKIFGCVGVCFSLVASVVNAAIIPPSPMVTLSWDYPVDQLGTNLTFKIYHASDLSLPVENWAVLTNVVGTNLSAKIPLTPGPRFFAVTASNAAGESGFATTSP